MPEIYEYAGFRYVVTHTEDHVTMTPVPGQHFAAARERNIRNAIQMYLDSVRETGVLPSLTTPDGVDLDCDDFVNGQDDFS
jgi:hypothetical protein